MKTKRIFVSDIHLSSKELYDKKDSAWFVPEKHEPRLLAFLEGHVLEKKEEVKDLVLLGDIFNTWVCPADKTPPSYGDIFKANPKVIAALKAIAKSGVNLYYLNGNHDFDLSRQEIKAGIPGIRPIRQYLSGRIHAEHGHLHDIYNRPDFISDPAYGRAIGYFISRLAASGGETDFGILDLPAYLDDVLEAALTTQTIFASIIEAMAERAGLGDADVIVMPGGGTVTVAEVKERYERLSGVYSVKEMIGDLYQRRHLHGPADRLCARSQFNVVVFGHTHNALIDKDWFLVEDRIYANTGSWCKDKAYAVEIDKSAEPGGPVDVSLLRVNRKGKVNKRTREKLR